MANNTIYVAKESFVTNLDGQEVIISKGMTRVRSGHKLLKGREEFFEPIEIQYDTERATAAPGEVREVKKPVPPKPAETKAVKKADKAESDE